MKHIFSFSKNKGKKELSSAKRLFIGSTLAIISVFLFTSFLSYFFTGDIDQSNLTNFTEKAITNSNSLGKIATMGLASAVFSPLMNITGSVLASYWSKRPIKK